MTQPVEYCDLCTAYTNSWEHYRHSEGGLYRLCSECIEMIRDGEPVTDETYETAHKQLSDARYVVTSGGQSDDSHTGETWHIKDTVTGHGVMPDNKRMWYPTKQEAQAVADKLNGK